MKAPADLYTAAAEFHAAECERQLTEAAAEARRDAEALANKPKMLALVADRFREAVAQNEGIVLPPDVQVEVRQNEGVYMSYHYWITCHFPNGGRLAWKDQVQEGWQFYTEPPPSKRFDWPAPDRGWEGWEGTAPDGSKFVSQSFLTAAAFALHGPTYEKGK